MMKSHRMKIFKSAIALVIGSVLLCGCHGGGDGDSEHGRIDLVSTDVKIATYSLDFVRTSFAELIAEMQISPDEQTRLVMAYLDKTIAAEEKAKAEHVIQIRNVAAIIQKTRPDVLMLSGYSGDGMGKNKAAIVGFLDNYLSVAQSLEGAGGTPDLKPISYPFFETYASNSGLDSGFDLDHSGVLHKLPEDAWGYGHYHGEYSLALMSKYKIETEKTRTFQTFKWKDMEGAQIPTITLCKNPDLFPAGMHCGDNWYSDKVWQQVRLSSSNHIDVPIVISTGKSNQELHLLMSQPTPPVYDLGKNREQNAAEVKFWHDYVQGKSYFYDDEGGKGGLVLGAKFVILGEENLDPQVNYGIGSVMTNLLDDKFVNQQVSNADLYPSSAGAAEYAADKYINHPYPERLTALSGQTLDYAIPSAYVEVFASGVYWPRSDEDGWPLLVDGRIGKYGDGNEVSSEHRMVWINAKFH